MRTFNENLKREIKKHPFKDWWNKNRYKIMRIILFPAWLVVELSEKYDEYRHKHFVYSDARVKILLNKYLPKYIKPWLEEDSSFLIFKYSGEYAGDPDLFSFPNKMNKKHKSYYWKFYRQIQTYFMEEYTIEGYKKYYSKADKDFYEVSGLREWDNREAVFFKKIK